MRLLRFALPAVLALSILAGSAVAADRDAFRDCVARNTVKYSEPGSSAVAQYVDVEAACRAALDDGPETGFVIVDAEGDRVGGGGSGDTAGPGDTGGSAQGGSGGSTPAAPQEESPVSPGEPETSTASAPATSPSAPEPPASGGASAGGGGAAGAGPAPAVASLPASAESVEPLAGTPAWLSILVALGIVAVVATAGLETYRRRRG